MTMTTVRRCRVCGCDDLHACVTKGRPCFWVAPDLCSACVGKATYPKKGLSFSRPWDYLILHPPFKDVENRDWSRPFRGRIYVHRAKSWDEDGYQWLMSNRLRLFIPESTITLAISAPAVSGIVGEVDITDCVTESNSPWFFKRPKNHGFVLANPVAYERLIPYRGMPSLFDVWLCHSCHKPIGKGEKFCEQCSQVGLEDDCGVD